MTPPNDSTSTPERPLRSISPTRRSVIRGAAWTTPAILLATAAPAHAVSGSTSLRILRYGDLDHAQPDGGFFGHDVYNDASATTSGLRSTLTVTADDAGRWGPSATAEAGGWVLLAVGGTGATRTFSFRAVTEVPATSSAIFDVNVTSGAGNLGAGTRGATVSDSTGLATYGPEKFTATAARRDSQPAARR